MTLFASLVALSLSVAVEQVAAGPRSAPSADGWVVIPIEDYRALRAKAFPPDPEAGPPPVEFAVTRIDCELRIDGESASGEARITVDVLKDGWVKLSLPRNLKVRSARVDGRTVALIAEAGREPVALLSKQGRTVLALDIATPVTAQGGAESIALPASNAALFRVVARIPKPASDFFVNGGILASKDETEGETRVHISVRPNENLSLSWRRRSETRRTTLAPKFRGRVTEVVGLGEETATTTAHAAVEMTQGALTSVAFSLPADFVVNQVSGALMADWDFKPGVLSVTFLEAVEGTARLVIQGESKSPREGVIEIPLIKMTGAERESGGVAVEVLGAGEIKTQRPQGLDPADPGELGEVVAGRDSPSLTAFRFRPLATGARSLSLDIARYTPQAVLLANVEEARYESLLTDEGKRLVRARYAIRNNQRSFLSVALPPGAILWSASVAGKPVRPGAGPSGTLLLPLQKTRGGEEAAAFAGEVIYFERADAWASQGGRATLSLPSLDLPVSRTGVLLYHSPEYRMTFDRGSFRVADFESPASRAFIASEDEEAFGRAPAAAPPSEKKEKDSRADAFQGLVDRFRQESRSGRMASSLPVQVDLPEVGTTTFLISELTGEGSTPSIAFAYKKGGKQ